MYDSSDPTRIPRVLEALGRAWEGQPDLTLTALMGVLANRGVGWGASDGELVEALAALEREHPSLLDAHPFDHLSIATVSPDLRITLAAGIAVVRAAREGSVMPSVWPYSSLRRTGPGCPLVVRDTEDIEHRLGVVELITRFDPHDAPPLEGLDRRDTDGARWLVLLGNGSRALVGHRIRVWEQLRREVVATDHGWERVLSCREGSEMTYAPAGGGEPCSLGRVTRVVVLETG